MIRVLLDLARRWIRKQWNLRRREFFLWRQKQYARAVAFYITERTIWRLGGKKFVASVRGAKIAKPSRQIHRAQERQLDKLKKQLKRRSTK